MGEEGCGFAAIGHEKKHAGWASSHLQSCSFEYKTCAVQKK